MFAGRLQLFIRGDAGRCRIVPGGSAQVMPDAEHGAHHDVHLAVGRFIQLLRINEKVNELTVDLDALSARVPVERTQIILPGILMVYIKEPVIFPQNARSPGRASVNLLCRVSCIAVHEGDCVKVSEVGLSPVLRFVVPK